MSLTSILIARSRLKLAVVMLRLAVFFGEIGEALWHGSRRQMELAGEAQKRPTTRRV